MYIVSEHGYGRSGHTLPNGQIWETSLSKHEWRSTSEHKRRQDAIQIAQGREHHSVVTRYGKTIYDNKKEPRSRIDWTK